MTTQSAPPSKEMPNSVFISLFVYGTLQTGESNHEFISSPFTKDGGRPAVTGPGRLWAGPGFPRLELSPSVPRVEGLPVPDTDRYIAHKAILSANAAILRSFRTIPEEEREAMLSEAKAQGWPDEGPMKPRWIHGEWHLLGNNFLKRLDELEGFFPGPETPLFVRSAVTIWLRVGKNGFNPRPAWVYHAPPGDPRTQGGVNFEPYSFDKWTGRHRFP